MHHAHVAGAALVAVVYCGAAWAREDEASAPKTVAEGIERIEKVLGKYGVDKDQQEWRIAEKSEKKKKVNPNEPEVLDAFDGVRIVSLPHPITEGVSFDEVMIWKRQVFDIGEGGQRKQTRAQTSHNVSRYSIQLHSGEWLVSGVMLSNGVHESHGHSVLRGSVKWHPDGFEFVGATGTGRYYAAGGKMILGTAYGSIRYVRQGDKLTLKTKFQPYYLAKDADGNTTTMPDFKRPITTAYENESTSDPLVETK